MRTACGGCVVQRCCGTRAVQVWQDDLKARQGDPDYLVLWRPVPPAGYVPLGLVAGLGPRPPPADLPVRWAVGCGRGQGRGNWACSAEGRKSTGATFTPA